MSRSEVVAQCGRRAGSSIEQRFWYSEAGQIKISAVGLDATLILDTRVNLLRVNERCLLLQATPARLLALLLLNQGTVMSRKTIFSEVWGYQFNPGTKIIDVQICYLRKILHTLQAPFEIKTFRSQGLRLQALEQCSTCHSLS
ncbi:winged helix-turn-helix domain-containing protein [Pseudomonas urmiensis]|uniref:winged helix-turn-helix domain-containing protein n=1 Tax=Pseudomonas urmiensis TaxID=2745493 RepID=UPI003CB401C8